MKYYSMDEARLLNHNGQIKAVSPTNVTTLYTRKKKSAIKTATVTIVPEVESKVTSKFSKERLVACIDINFVSDQDDAGLFDSFASNIAESTYDGMNVDNVIKENCSHLTKEQQKDLRELLLQHEKLFDGTLRTYTDKKMDIELLPEASAVYRRPYSVPQLHMEVFRKELQRLCDIGVLKRCGPSEWGLPSFIIPKKDGKVRWVSDLRELNKAIKPVNYTLPIISDIVRKRQGYKYMTKLDLSMMFYAIELTDRAKELCVISTHFGNFQYEGAKTLKMKFGHHGANHPVKDLDTGRVAITSQNHGFAVDAKTLPNDLRVTHVSLFDGSLQGLAWKDKPAFCFQGHPEASPGPHDIAYLFDRFIHLMNTAGKGAQ